MKRNFKNAIKSIIGVVTCVSVSFTSLMPVLAEEVMVGPSTIANIQVVDSEGNSVDGGKMYLYDSNGNSVASWTSNDDSTVSSSYKAKNTFTKMVEDFKVPGKPEAEVEHINIGNAKYYYSVGFEYGQTYEAKLFYKDKDNEKVDLTVPAGKMMIAVDSEIANKTSDVGVGIGEDTSNKTVYWCNDIAGQEVYYDLPVGTHDAYICMNIGSAGGGSVTISDSSVNYTKQTINLHEVAPDEFNANGTITKGGSEFGFGTETSTMRAFMYIISGSVVNVVVPDANSNVTIYIDTSTLEYSCSAYYSGRTSTGGWISGMLGEITLDFIRTVDLTLKTPTLPEPGINLVGLKLGEYTIVQRNTVDGYENPMDYKITIADTEDVQSFKFVNEKEVLKFTSQPKAANVNEEEAFALEAVMSGNDSSTTYQWYKDGVAISGATTLKYSVASAKLEDAGEYYVVATKNGQNVTSDVVKVTVKEKQIPTTEAPTTEAPTTEAPTTQAPTTEAPTTEAPTTQAPTTEAPTTEVPTTEAPTTQAPTTEAPTTEVPTTEAPTTVAPATEAPAEEEPEVQTDEPAQPVTPNTGDDGNYIAFLGITLASVFVMLGVMATSMKKENE